jgi:hypothetical protein
LGKVSRVGRIYKRKNINKAKENINENKKKIKTIKKQNKK